MRQILTGIVLVLSALAVGCQQTIPQYKFPCTYRAVDAGFCDDPYSGRLVGYVLHGDR
jgi:hypothetical protein